MLKPLAASLVPGPMFATLGAAFAAGPANLLPNGAMAQGE